MTRDYGIGHVISRIILILAECAVRSNKLVYYFRVRENAAEPLVRNCAQHPSFFAFVSSCGFAQ